MRRRKGEGNLNRAYKYRIYPSEEQCIFLAKSFGCCRFIYNKMLSDKITAYNENGTMLKCTPAQYKKELKLSERIYRCACGNEMDRDVNAAINIREEGKRMLYA